MNSYMKSDAWGGASIRTTAKGYVVESWSRIHGNRTGRIVLVLYNEYAPEGASLDQAWHDHMILADALISEDVCFASRYIKVLRRGEVVQ